MNKLNLSKREKGLLLMLFVLAFCAGLFVRDNHLFIDNFLKQEAKQIDYENKIKERIEGETIEAFAVSVLDVGQNKVIYSKNDEVIMPIASLTKIMTIMTAMQNNSPREITITAQALKEPMDHGLILGEKWNIYELSEFTAITSSNDGAVALTEGDQNFVNSMNIRALDLGLFNTYFNNATGLDIEGLGNGGYSTAREVNRLATYAYLTMPEIFDSTVFPEKIIYSRKGFTHVAQNTNIILDQIPNLLFSKTGYTNSAGGCLTVIMQNEKGRVLAITVLGSSFEGRFEDMKKISNILISI